MLVKKIEDMKESSGKVNSKVALELLSSAADPITIDQVNWASSTDPKNYSSLNL